MRQHPHLFEISAWPWLTRLSHDQGRHVRLADVPGAEWDRIARKGVDLLYLMGVWRRSAIGRVMARTDPGLLAEYDRVLPGWTMGDVVGSPYSIQAYEPDERMGGWSGLDAARAELSARGIRLVLDFVPNHTGFDHAWIASSPERYVLGALEDYRRSPDAFRPIERNGDLLFVACGRDPYFPAWRDVAQLNYFNPDTRDAMAATLATIAQHCDGVRCDMAMLVLNDIFERTWRGVLRERWPSPVVEFWRGTTWAVDSLIYLAEVYWDLEAAMLDQGFHYAYDKRLLDALNAPGTTIAGQIRERMASTSPDRHQLARFLENHDESRSAAVLDARLPAAATLVSTAPGMRFFFDGQFEGRRIKTPVQLGRWADEPADPRVVDLYNRLLGTAASETFHSGDWQLLSVSGAGDDTFDHLVAYRWRGAGGLAVVVVNPGGGVAQGHIDLRPDLPAGPVINFEDQLTGCSYPWRRDTLVSPGLYVRLDPGQAHVFVVRPGT